MKTNIKAALLSALVLPGLGQLRTGRKAKGILIIAAVNIFLLIAVTSTIRSMGKVAGPAGGGEKDAAQTIAALQKESPMAGWLLLLFFIIWAYAVIDALLDRHSDTDRHPLQM